MRIPYLKKNDMGKIEDPRMGRSLIGDIPHAKRVKDAQSHLVEWAGLNVDGDITTEQLLKMYNMNLETMKSFYSFGEDGTEVLAYSDEAIKQIEKRINEFCTKHAHYGDWAEDIYDSVQPALENVYTQKQSRLRVQLNILINTQQEQIVEMLKQKGFDTTTLESCSELTTFEQPQDVSISFPENKENLLELLQDAHFATKLLKPFLDKSRIYVSADEVKKAQKEAEAVSNNEQSYVLTETQKLSQHLQELQRRYQAIQNLTIDDLPELQKQYEKLVADMHTAEADADKLFDLNSTYYGRYSSDLESANEDAQIAEQKVIQQKQILEDIQNPEVVENEIDITGKQIRLLQTRKALSPQEYAAWEKYSIELAKYKEDASLVNSIPALVEELQTLILPQLTRACDQFENVKTKNQYPYYIFDQFEVRNSFLDLPMFIDNNKDISNPLGDVSLDPDKLLETTKSGLPLGFVFTGKYQLYDEIVPTEIARDVQRLLEVGFLATYQYNVDNPMATTGESILSQTKDIEEIIHKLKYKSVTVDNYTPVEIPTCKNAENATSAWEIAGISEEEFKQLTPIERAGLFSFASDIPTEIVRQIYEVEKPSKKKKTQNGQGDGDSSNQPLEL